MKRRYLNRRALWTLAGIVTLGCVPIITLEESRNSISPDGNQGFVDGGGFFADEERGGGLPPLVAEAGDETETQSFFSARSIDPASEDSAGPKFVETADIDNDGLPDLATAWNQNQVIQIHLQRRDADGSVRFESVQIAGTTPIAIVAGIKLADMDADGWIDIVVLVKHQGLIPVCPGTGDVLPDAFTGVALILFSPGGAAIEAGENWTETIIDLSLEANPDGTLPPGLPGTGPNREIDVPEEGGMTALDVGDVTGDGLPDVVVTSNRPEPPCHPIANDVELYPNPGAAVARVGTAWDTQIIVDRDAPVLKAMLLFDVDMDGDLDVVFTRPAASSQNISWRENLGGGVMGIRRPIGHIDTGADIMALGDVDADGLTDILVRSNAAQVLQWFRHPGPSDQLNVSGVLSGIPWSVFSLIELVDTAPLGISLGDINFDGQPEVLLGADGRILWLDSSTAPSVFDNWSPNLIVDDSLVGDPLFGSAAAAFINNLLVVDIDCDGANDIIGTIDRQDLSGLSTDVLVWFRNTLLPEDVGIDQPLVPGCP